MARQRELFREATVDFELNPDRKEPALWVRRLVIWSKSGEVLRDIALRRGLNIIWSRDPGAAAAALGRQQESGHGAGKTLFCRLLRYCLGEETFAQDELRGSVALAFPEGLVGAEVRIAGRTWGVVRSLSSNRSVAVEGRAPEDLAGEIGRRPGIEPLVEAILERVLDPGLQEFLPSRRPEHAWLTALAWLARDQECRFSHLLSWRHPTSNSGSPAAGAPKENLLAVRALLRVLSTGELTLRQEIEALAAERKRLEQERASLPREEERMRGHVAGRLLVDAATLPPGTLALPVLRENAEKTMREAQRPFDATDLVEKRDLLRLERDEIVGQIAVLEEKRNKAEGLVALHKDAKQKLRGEDSTLEAATIKALLGDYCPVCSVPIDRALAEGCGLSSLVWDPADLDAKRVRVEDRLRTTEAEMVRNLEEVSRLECLLVTRRSREADLRRELRGLEEEQRTREEQHRTEWLAAAVTVEHLDRLERLREESSRLTKEIGGLEARDSQHRTTLSAYRDGADRALAPLRTHFRSIAEALLGADAETHLELSGDSLRARLLVGGAAMESLKVLVFDLASLLLAIEGRAGLPAFLIHDSPREGDLGLSHYHRLFHLAAGLEARFEAAPFQYIVTTTTEPPQELVESESLVLKLAGREASERLLGQEV
ncbi:MAG TPA: hypothetical protein VF017_23715 [Thermoanaerobaculia bacterium]|nr:hypothetical protein [Thermoanaerobaculia bacterium]